MTRHRLLGSLVWLVATATLAQSSSNCDGTDDHLLDTTSSYVNNDESYSWSAWARIETLQSLDVIVNDRDSGGSRLRMTLTLAATDDLSASWRDNLNVLCTNSIVNHYTANTWTAAVVTRNDAASPQGTVYSKGVTATCSTNVGADTHQVGNYTVFCAQRSGASSIINYLDGQVAWAAYYDYPLTANQATELRYCIPDRAPSSLWMFLEAGNIIDRGSNGNTLVRTGGANTSLFGPPIAACTAAAVGS